MNIDIIMLYVSFGMLIITVILTSMNIASTENHFRKILTWVIAIFIITILITILPVLKNSIEEDLIEEKRKEKSNIDNVLISEIRKNKYLEVVRLKNEKGIYFSLNYTYKSDTINNISSIIVTEKGDTIIWRNKLEALEYLSRYDYKVYCINKIDENKTVYLLKDKYY